MAGCSEQQAVGPSRDVALAEIGAAEILDEVEPQRSHVVREGRRVEPRDPGLVLRRSDGAHAAHGVRRPVLQGPLVDVGEDDLACRRGGLRDPGERGEVGLAREIDRDTEPGEEPRHDAREAAPGEHGRQRLGGEIGGYEAHVGRDRGTTRLEPLPLHRLGRRVVDLEDLDVAGEERLSHDEAVEAGADEHVLTGAPGHGRLERVLGVPRADDHAAVCGMSTQRDVDHGLLGAERLELRPSLRSGACKDAPIERRLLGGRHQRVAPRIVDQLRAVVPSVGGSHERRAQCRPAGASIGHWCRSTVSRNSLTTVLNAPDRSMFAA